MEVRLNLRHDGKTRTLKETLKIDVRNTPFQNVKRVFKSCVEKVTKKAINKRLTKKASNTETVKKVQQMFENELLSTFDDQGEA